MGMMMMMVMVRMVAVSVITDNIRTGMMIVGVVVGVVAHHCY